MDSLRPPHSPSALPRPQHHLDLALNISLPKVAGSTLYDRMKGLGECKVNSRAVNQNEILLKRQKSCQYRLDSIR